MCFLVKFTTFSTTAILQKTDDVNDARDVFKTPSISMMEFVSKNVNG